jgi:hypothetical protein
VSRRVAWSIAGLVMFVGLAVGWFLSAFERVPVHRREAAQAEAVQNPYLALERVLVRMGRPLARTTDADLLHRLPEPGALILDRGRAYHLTGARLQALWEWVDRGGYLLLVPEVQGAPDPVTDVFELAWTDSLEDDGDDDVAGLPTPRPEVTQELPQLAVVVPDVPQPLMVEFHEGLTVLGREPEWTAAHPDRGAQLLHFTYGEGAVSVVAHLDELISNDRIGNLDHAELVWTLLERYQPRGAVVLLSRLYVPTLGQWLLTHAPLVLLSVTVLLGVWLWAVVPRFGAVAPDPAPDRRELREHLLAVGRFVREQGGGDVWLSVVRSALSGAIGRRLPGWRPGRGDVESLAAHTGIPPADLTHAFSGDGDRADRLVVTMRALQRVERSL